MSTVVVSDCFRLICLPEVIVTVSIRSLTQQRSSALVSRQCMMNERGDVILSSIILYRQLLSTGAELVIINSISKVSSQCLLW